MSNENIPIDASQVSQWLGRIRSCEKLVEENHLPQWRRVSASYASRGRGGMDGLDFGEGGDIHFNYLLSTANVILPSIVSANPYIRARARREQDVGSADLAEGILNYAWREIGGTKVVQRAVLDALLYGVGFIKMSYDDAEAFVVEPNYEEGPEKPVPGGDRIMEDDDGMRRLRGLAAEEGFLIDDGPVDMPVISRVAPWNMGGPVGFTDIKQWPYIYDRVTYHIDDLKNVPWFDVPDDIQADSWLQEGVPKSLGASASNHTHQPQSTPEFVVTYELRYWHRNDDGSMRRRVLHICPAAGRGDAAKSAIAHFDDPMEMRGYPYVMLRLTESPDDFYATHISDLGSILDIADRLNHEWAYVIKHHEISSKRKYLIAEGALESGDLQRLLSSSQDMEAAAVHSPTGRVSDVIAILPEAPPPSDTQMVINGLTKLMYEISGVDVYQRGGVGRKGTTATEVSVAHAGAENRARMRLESVEDFLRNISRKMLEIIRQFWDEPRHIRVVGQDGSESFKLLSSSDIRGMYDIDIEPGSTLPTDLGSEVQAFQGFLASVQQAFATFMPALQAGMIESGTLDLVIHEAVRVWRQNQRGLLSPLAQLQTALMPSMSGTPGGSRPPEGGAAPAGDEVGSVDGRGMDAQGGGALAGNQERGVGLETLLARNAGRGPK